MPWPGSSANDGRRGRSPKLRPVFGSQQGGGEGGSEAARRGVQVTYRVAEDDAVALTYRLDKRARISVFATEPLTL